MGARETAVVFDPVVQRGLCGWMVADSEGTIYSRHDTREEAKKALKQFCRERGIKTNT